ncbi:hypothetical protein [Roseateles sp. P5_E11]
MADSRTVSGTVTTENDGPSRVAFDLMNRIARAEDGAEKDREYFLRLYAQCNILTNHPTWLDDALKLNTK